MVGRRIAPLTEQARSRGIRNYGTMDSDDSPETKSSESHQEAEKRAIDLFWCIRYFVIALVTGLGLIWLWNALKYNDDVNIVSLFLPPESTHVGPEQGPQYLWVIEHDRSAQDTSLATQTSLYKSDSLMTKTSDGSASTIHNRTWNLDRASYDDLYLDDILQDRAFYNAILEADLVFCEYLVSTGAPVLSAQCRLVGNSYFSHSTSRSWWPMLSVFNVAADFNLADRPQFHGRHRIQPYPCGATKSDTTDISVTIHKSSSSLSVECSTLFALDSEGSVLHRDDNAPISACREGDAVVGVVAPGFYIIPDRHVPEYPNNRHEKQCGDTIKDEDTPGCANTLQIAAKTMETSLFSDEHSACTPSTAPWARLCHGNLRDWEPAIQSRTTLYGILRRAPNPGDPNSSQHPLLGLFVAIGMLVLMSALALAGALVRRHLERRARLGVARALEEISNEDLNKRPRYLRLLQPIQAICRFKPKNSQGLERQEVQEGNSPRKLQKTKGTRFEDPTDLRPQVESPPLAASIERPIGESSSVEKRADSGSGDNIGPGSVEYVEGSPSAHEQRSHNGATRRSNRSTSVHDEHVEDS